MSSDAMIEIRGLGKRYRIAGPAPRRRGLGRWLGPRAREDFWALRDLDLDVRRGAILGIVGRNGAGKSTLLKILSRITEPSTGSVRLWGRVGSLLEVGTGFHRELTGRENIHLNGSILGMRRREIERRFDEIVDFAGVERFLDTPVKRYSSGMYVRLAFAVAAHLDTEIVIVDEVLAVGDVQFQRKCLGKMGEIARDSRTVLLVSHNMASVLALCDRAIVLDGGRMVREGTPQDCAATYARIGVDDGGGAEVAFERPDTASAWMEGARLLCRGAVSGSVAMGDELTLEVDFRADRPIHPNLGVVISNAQAVRVLHVSSRYAPAPELDRPTRGGTLRCELGVVPFTAGDHHVDLFFGGAVDDTHVVHGALSFEVTPHDLWGAGRIYESAHSVLWWPARLSLLDPGRVAVALPRR